MKISQNKTGSSLVVSVEGHVDTVTAPELQRSVDLTGVSDLVLDLSRVDYVSSAGLRVFITFQKTMNAAGTMSIRNPSPDVLKVFEMTGFSNIFTITGTGASAEASAEAAPANRRTFPSMRHAVDLVRKFVEEDTSNPEIMVAIDEIVSNIVKYANVKMFTVEKNLVDGTLELVFSDGGPAFNPLSLTRAEGDVSRAEDASTFGLGIQMVRQSMDVFQYVRKDNKNVLTIAKKI